MLTQSERNKIREIIKSKIAVTIEDVLQLENASSSDALLCIPGNQKKDAAFELKQKKVMLMLLQQAFVSVNHEWFGNCNRCGNPIPFNRLLAAPK